MTPSAGISCDERGRVELAHDDAAGALVHPGHGPAAAADVEQRHGDEVHGVRARGPTCRRPPAAGRRSCRSRASRPWAGPSSRSSRAGRRRRRVRSACADRPARARRPTRRSPGTCSWPPMTRIVPTEVRASAMASRIGTKSGPTTNTLAWASLTMNSTSGGGEAPVDVDAHGVGEGGAEEHLEVLDAVLVQERDAVLRPDAGRAEPGGDAARPLVQLGPGLAAIAQHEGGAVGLVSGVRRAGCRRGSRSPCRDDTPGVTTVSAGPRRCPRPAARLPADAAHPRR